MFIRSMCKEQEKKNRRERYINKKLGIPSKVMGRPKVADYIDGNRRALSYLFSGKYGVDNEFTKWIGGHGNV